MSENDVETQDMQAAYDKVQALKRIYEAELMSKANVVGVGIGLHQRGGVRLKTVALIVMVTHKVPRSQLPPEDVIPREIEGVPVDVQAVGQIRPH